MNTKLLIKQNEEVKQFALFETEPELQDFLQVLNSGNTCWGKPEHQIVLEAEKRIEHAAIEAVAYQSPKEAVLDENGEELEAAVPEILAVEAQEAYVEVIPAVMQTIPSEFTVEIVDISAEIEQARVNAESEQYLKNTDWYVLRMMDSGVPVPEGIQLLRQQARDRIVRS